MPNRLWEGEERREHDHACDAKWKERYREISKDICLATKPTKLKQAILWATTGLAITLALTIAGRNYSRAGEQAVLDKEQSLEIYHHEERLDEMVEQTDAIVKDINDIQKDVGQIRNFMGQQTQILKALAREHSIDVGIE